MEFTIWDAATLVSKFVFYFSFAALVAGLFIDWFANHETRLNKTLFNYVLTGAFSGVISVIAYFFVQVGSMSESGWRGMWDPLMVQLIWDTAIGVSTIYRFWAMAVIGLVSWGYFKGHFFANKKALFVAIYFVCLLALGYSFTLTGHIAEIDILTRGLLAIHVLIMAWWIGSLWPLRQICQTSEPKLVSRVMTRFGELAVYCVPLLVFAGIFLVTRLLESWQELIDTQYGRVLLSKIILVAAILLLAAIHKLRLVPAIKSDEQAIHRLERSINLELFIGISILLVTSFLTSSVGPTH